MYKKKYHFNVYEFLEEWIHAFVAKLDNRCFCWFPSAMLELIQVSTSMASPYKSLEVWVKHFFGFLVYEIFLWPESWRGSWYMYLLEFPRFWTLSIERFWFLFSSILNGVTLTTSNKEHSFFIFILYKITLLSGAFFSLSRFWRTQERLCIMNRVRSLLSMRCMLLGGSFEPRPNNHALGTTGSVMTISKKLVWRGKTRLNSPEFRAAATSKTWRDSGRASFSPPQSRRRQFGRASCRERV